MLVDVCYTPAEYEGRPKEYWPGRTAVVFDVLRATSTIVTALAAGYTGVRCFRETADAKQYAATHSRTALAGERDGVPQTGFRFGNSPREFSRKAPDVDEIALTTTNGTRAVAAAAGAKRVVIASLLNLSATANFLRDDKAPLTIVCSGSDEDPALEDELGAGALLAALKISHPLVALYETHRHNLRAAFRAAKNGAHLVEIGLGEDIEHCLRQDIYDVVPVLAEDGCIRTISR